MDSKLIYKKITNNPIYVYQKVIKISQKYRNYKINNKHIRAFLYGIKNNKNIYKYSIEINGQVGKNLVIHHGNIVISKDSILGDNIVLHGNNCIGNNGQNKKSPKIGNNVNIGWGTAIIGDVEIADNITIGANSVVTKSFLTPNITIAGNPAKQI